MKKSEIHENNVLIANFMYGNLVNVSSKTVFVGSRYVFITDLKYDTSWDWLMPVYKKLSDEIDKFETKLKSHKGRKWIDKQAPLHNINSCYDHIKLHIWGVRIKETFNGIAATIKILERYKQELKLK